MDLHVTDNFLVPPASLSLFDTIIILVLIPFMDRVIYPCLKKLKIRMTSLRRMGIGMLFAILSVVVAANIEVSIFFMSNNQEVIPFSPNSIDDKINFSYHLYCRNHSFSHYFPLKGVLSNPLPINPFPSYVTMTVFCLLHRCLLHFSMF